jgi:cytochrome P450
MDRTPTAAHPSPAPSYDPYDYELDKDPHPAWKRLRDEAPLYYNEQFDFWALSRFDDVYAASMDPETFSSAHGTVLETIGKELSPWEQELIIYMDPPRHTMMRKLVSRAFTPRRIDQLEADIASLVAEYLDPHRGATSFDYVGDFGALLPPMVIGALLGVPPAERDLVRLWFDRVLHREPGSTEPSALSIKASGELVNYVIDMVADRRRVPRDDLVTGLIEAEIVEDGGTRRLTDSELCGFVMMLSGAGVETVARLLSWTAVVLAANPDQRRLLVDDPSLVPNAVEELLRFEAPSPIQSRYLTRPVERYGTVVPEGSKVSLLTGSAGRDERAYDDPDRFDVGRSITKHLSLGYGAHYCLGASLARMEGRIALEGTLARFPEWEVDESELEWVHTSTVRGFHHVPIHLPG